MKRFDFNLVTMISFFQSADVHTISKKYCFGPLRTTFALCSKNTDYYFHDRRFFFLYFPCRYGKNGLQ
jgi:hypothetical protein